MIWLPFVVLGLWAVYTLAAPSVRVVWRYRREIVAHLRA